MNNDMDWIKVEMYRHQLHRERIRQHGQAVAPVHPLEANAKVAHGRRPQLLSTRQKLAWLKLSVVSFALIFIVAWWFELNELGGGAGVKWMTRSLTEQRQSGELPAQSFTTEEARGDLKHGVISRLEALPPTAAGIGNDSTSAGKDKDKSRNTTSSTLLAKSDNLPVTTGARSHETISNTGPAMSAVPLADDALMRLQKLAESGDTKAQNFLGIMYATGEGVPKNTAKAAEWFEKAAAQGDADAQTILGHMYATGDGVPKNAVKSAEWYQKSADLGFAPSMNNLGQIYLYGLGGLQDRGRAFDLHMAAAKAGNPVAAWNVAIAFSAGFGVDPDPAEAKKWRTWTPPAEIMPDLLEPTLARTKLYGSTLTEAQRANLRATTELGEPATFVEKPMKADPSLPSFHEATEKMWNQQR